MYFDLKPKSTQNSWRSEIPYRCSIPLCQEIGALCFWGLCTTKCVCQDFPSLWHGQIACSSIVAVWPKDAYMYVHVIKDSSFDEYHWGISASGDTNRVCLHCIDYTCMCNVNSGDYVEAVYIGGTRTLCQARGSRNQEWNQEEVRLGLAPQACLLHLQIFCLPPAPPDILLASCTTQQLVLIVCVNAGSLGVVLFWCWEDMSQGRLQFILWWVGHMQWDTCRCACTHVMFCLQFSLYWPCFVWKTLE